MGARTQVGIRAGGDSNFVFLYSHWGAEEIVKRVREGLKAGQNRWDDPDYLARIIFDFMKEKVGDGAIGSTTGFGIGVELQTDIDILVLIDCETCFVNVMDKEGGATDNWEGFTIDSDELDRMIFHSRYLTFAGTIPGFIEWSESC